MEWVNQHLGLIQSLMGVGFAIVVFYLKKSFVSIEAHNETKRRVDHIEDTYATSEEVDKLEKTLLLLPTKQDAKELTKEIHQVSLQMSRLETRLDGISRPVTAIVDNALMKEQNNGK